MLHNRVVNVQCFIHPQLSGDRCGRKQAKTLLGFLKRTKECDWLPVTNLHL